MSAIQIADNTWAVGVKDPNLKRFDIIMELSHGTSYNAYVIKGSEKTVLIDTVKARFTDEYFANLEEVVRIKEVDYLVVNHTESDHSGAIVPLLERNPKIELFCSAPALPFVRATVNDESVKVTGVKDDFELDLGEEKLTFKITPQMHWPDTMMDYLPSSGILFTCDGYAAHVSEGTYVDEIDGYYDEEFRDYYDKIMRFFSTYIRRNLAKIDTLDVKMIAPSHGPIIRKDVDKYLKLYHEYAADKSEGKNQVAIFYISAYGYTEKLANQFGVCLQEKGYTPVLIDTMQLDEKSARDTIEQSRALMYGTLTINGDSVPQMWNAIGLLSSVASQGKKAAVFGSYGWGGEALKLVADRLSGMKLKVFEENYRARLVPSTDEESELRAYCDRFAEWVG